MSFELGSRLLCKQTAKEGRPSTFSLLGREWDLSEGVFAPLYEPSTELFTTWLPYPRHGTFLEIGCGAGVTTVTAALSGCSRVTAVDINAAAVDNTLRNARRHGVEDRVRVLRSDLFSALGEGERFDVVCWNSNFVEPPDDFVPETDLDRAIFDPSYDTHREFLRQVGTYKAPGGRILLGFSSLGNQSRLQSLCHQADLGIRVLNTFLSAGPARVESQLLELLPARNREMS